MVMTVQPPLPVIVNTDFELVCVVTGDDAPDVIMWMFNDTGAIIFTGNATTGGNLTIIISDMSYGIYVCTASNAFGSSQSSITIVQAGMLYICLAILYLYAECIMYEFPIQLGLLSLLKPWLSW